MSNKLGQLATKLPDDGFLEIRDSALDQAEILEEIRQRIQKRRQELGYETQSFRSYGSITYPEKPDIIPYNADLYYHLRKMNEGYKEVGVEIQLQPSPSTRIPVIGKFWQQVRTAAHGLVLFYLDITTKKQLTINREFTNVINLLVAHSQQQQYEILRLEEEIEDLKRRLGEQ
jgi:hypothetical protein